MASVDDYNLPEDLKYFKEHEWIRVEGDVATVGVSDYAQKELGDVVFVELPKVGAVIEAAKEFCTLESAKAVAPVYAPVSGEITEVNDALLDTPEQVNTAPYDAWIAKVKLTKPEEVDTLMNGAAYKAFVQKLLTGEH